MPAQGRRQAGRARPPASIRRARPWARPTRARRRHRPRRNPDNPASPTAAMNQAAQGGGPPRANGRQRSRATSAHHRHEQATQGGAASPQDVQSQSRGGPTAAQQAQGARRPASDNLASFRPRSAKPAASIRAARSPSAWTPSRGRNGSPADHVRREPLPQSAWRRSARPDRWPSPPSLRALTVHVARRDSARLHRLIQRRSIAIRWRANALWPTGGRDDEPDALALQCSLLWLGARCACVVGLACQRLLLPQKRRRRTRSELDRNDARNAIAPSSCVHLQGECPVVRTDANKDHASPPHCCNRVRNVTFVNASETGTAWLGI